MKKYLLYLQLFVFSNIIFTACNTATPEKYFGIAVLNVNRLFGFADAGLLRQLESPSVKLADNGETVPMKRTELINTQIEFVETNLDELKSLKRTDDTKDLLEASTSVYEFVLPVYKNEYTKLAELYDNNAPNDQIQKLSNSIHDKYYSAYTDLFNKLISTGKAYAEKNNIKVNWDVRTSP